MRNLYKVLGISSTADHTHIKSAFRRRAKIVHPDLNPGDRRAEQRFTELTHAYEVLRNARARASYDAFLAENRRAIRRRVAGSAALMVSSFTLTVGAAYLALALHDTSAGPWGSWHLANAWRHAVETTTAAAARQVNSAGDWIAQIAATVVASATPPPTAARTPGTEIAKAAVVTPAPATETGPPVSNVGKLKGTSPEPRQRADDSASMPRTEAASVRRRVEPEPQPPAKARKKLAAATQAPKRSSAAERNDAAAQVARPRGEASRPWPTADEPFMGLGATSR